jgi:aerobic carbon-monoxide dehydrogenase medium subunit
MITTKFDYVAPENLTVARELLINNPNAHIITGTSLITAIKLGQISPSLLVDLHKIPQLKGINLPKIGPLTTYTEIVNHSELNKTYHALVQASSMIGDVQIRNQQTIGETFAYKDLACDFLAVAIALDLQFLITGSEGPKSLSTQQFLNSSLPSGDILTEVELPVFTQPTGSVYLSFKHPASGYTLCGVAAVISKADDGTINHCAIASTGAYTQAIKLLEVETSLQGKHPTEENIKAAAKLAKLGTINSDQADVVMLKLMEDYADLEYRNHIVTVLTERAIKQALN